MEGPTPGRFRQVPDLWWPRDRAWFVAGDTDLDWLDVARTTEYTDAVVAAVGDRCRAVDPLGPVA